MAIQFLPTEEQVMLRDGLRRWGAARDVRTAEPIEATWAYGAGQGWLMAGLPAEAGGLGGSVYDSAIIAEELGRALVRAPFVEIGMVTAGLIAELTPARAAEIASGSQRPLLAHDELEARGDPNWIETRAEQCGDGWVLDGRKTALVGAPFADAFLVTARIADNGVGLFEVAPEDAGLRVFTTVDDRAGGELRLNNARAKLIAAPDMAKGAIVKALDHALVLESAEALGAMQRVLELTKDYLLTRKQYDHLLGDFQSLRHRFADMFIEVEQARSIVLRGVESLISDATPARAGMAAAVKAQVARGGFFVGAQGIQLHGGIGVTDEYPIGHYFKRLQMFAQRHGGADRQIQRYAEMMSA